MRLAFEWLGGIGLVKNLKILLDNMKRRGRRSGSSSGGRSRFGARSGARGGSIRPVPDQRDRLMPQHARARRRSSTTREQRRRKQKTR